MTMESLESSNKQVCAVLLFALIAVLTAAQRGQRKSDKAETANKQESVAPANILDQFMW